MSRFLKKDVEKKTDGSPRLRAHSTDQDGETIPKKGYRFIYQLKVPVKQYKIPLFTVIPLVIVIFSLFQLIYYMFTSLFHNNFLFNIIILQTTVLIHFKIIPFHLIVVGLFSFIT